MTPQPWLWWARARRKALLPWRRLGPLEPLIDELAPGRSFIDVGALWNVHGKVAFRAEERGAADVTALDVSSPTEEYRAEHERRGSAVRFVHGDIHDDAARAEAGPHDVVWCSGVLYHCPDPVHTLRCLREVTKRTLVLISATIPEVPWKRQAAVFFPGLPESERHAYDRAFTATSGIGAPRLGLTTPFDPGETYGNWWWGLTPSAVRAMLQVTGFEVTRTMSDGFHSRFVARAV
jgi:SAM-dependent methyltransferase